MDPKEIQRLPRVEATLTKVVSRNRKSTSYTLTVHIAKDFNFVKYLTEAQYSLIKLERNINYDNQKLQVYCRISKGGDVENIFYLLEVLPTESFRFSMLLELERVRVIEIMQKQKLWPAELEIGVYPDKVEDIVELPKAEEK